MVLTADEQCLFTSQLAVIHLAVGIKRVCVMMAQVVGTPNLLSVAGAPAHRLARCLSGKRGENDAQSGLRPTSGGGWKGRGAGRGEYGESHVSTVVRQRAQERQSGQGSIPPVSEGNSKCRKYLNVVLPARSSEPKF